MKSIRLIRTFLFQKPIQILNRLCRKLKLLKVKEKNFHNEYNTINLLLPEDYRQNIDLFVFGRFYPNIKWKNHKPLKTYHLNYFDYIHNYKQAKGIELILKWINENKELYELSWDPYPTSLRIVNWIKYIIKNKIERSEINNSLFRQADILFKRREYHLLTNHLFKNIVALLYSGVIFNNEKWKKWAINELKKQLQEQLTVNNYHFELSPTYHAIFTQDLLDIYNLLLNNNCNESIEIFQTLKRIIPDALSWCNYFSSNDEYLKINDVNYEGCPTLYELHKYAKLLGIYENKNIQQNIHYPVLQNNNLKLMMYCAAHQPAYNPAHSHDDLTSILLWLEKKPILIDTGNYCYDDTEERGYSRSTKAHNCFTVSGNNQSEMWKVFRIGKRAKLLSREITENRINCTHNGYKDSGILYTREISSVDNGFEIRDVFHSKKKRSYEIYFHFHPDCSIVLKENEVIVDDQLEVTFSSKRWDIIETDHYPQMFQKVKKKTILLQGPVHEKQHLTKITVIK
jgi:uncharacterized heparinase superfamily protein